ncbi:MAG: type II toxin-antitoxin system HicB family antitoxin [Chloroflexi bacterium]|nr:MAG: type II toxin-antitoxin system HicB family antitoxin [Chloroflexota bacterium]
MDKKLRQQAEQLAKRPYTIEIQTEALSDDSIVFVASHPELPGCIAHSDTQETLLEALYRARIDYIYFLLLDGLPIPEPENIMQTSSNVSHILYHIRADSKDSKDDINDVKKTILIRQTS